MDNTKIIPFELEYDAQQVKANPFQYLILFKKFSFFRILLICFMTQSEIKSIAVTTMHSRELKANVLYIGTGTSLLSIMAVKL